MANLSAHIRSPSLVIIAAKVFVRLNFAMTDLVP